MLSAVKFNAGLINKYGLTGPRYTSYPTAVSFHEGFDETAYQANAALSNEDLIPRPLSVYVHLPFCNSLCYYCACNKKITRHVRHGERYLTNLHREIAQRAALFDQDRVVKQLHFGGGTPTFFNDAQLSELLDKLGTEFTLDDSPAREFSIEIDPRTVDAKRLSHLKDLGFNRISLGVQDLDHQVQLAVNRVQDPDDTLALVEAARSRGFGSVSLDLIYGLPRQTARSFMATIDAVVDARPDRLSIYNYAHLPRLFRAQRLINDDDLPSPKARIDMLSSSIDRLTRAGYVYIGMDHFALPDDELTRARQEGTLQRNFQGYATFADCDLIGLGVSAISKVGASYAQNIKDLQRWNVALEGGHTPLWRGIQLGFEDRLRRAVIESIMCHGAVDFQSLEARFNIDVADYFALELQRLGELRNDGLVRLNEQGIKVTPEGLLLLRAVAMVFDESLSSSAPTQAFSKVI